MTKVNYQSKWHELKKRHIVDYVKAHAVLVTLRKDTSMYKAYKSTCRQIANTLLQMDRLDNTKEFENILRDIEDKKTYVKILKKYKNGEYTETN